MSPTEQLLMMQPPILAAALTAVASATWVGMRSARAVGVELARLTFGQDES